MLLDLVSQLPYNHVPRLVLQICEAMYIHLFLYMVKYIRLQYFRLFCEGFYFFYMLPIELDHSRYFFGNLLAIMVVRAIVIMVRFTRSAIGLVSL
jgi:hypothetical protein